MVTAIQSKLTDRQKKKYEEEFRNLIQLSPESIQKLWVEDGISWDEDTPRFVNDVHLKLKEKCWGRFMDLNRKLISRNL